jgi:hypothetical protein
MIAGGGLDADFLSLRDAAHDSLTCALEYGLFEVDSLPPGWRPTAFVRCGAPRPGWLPTTVTIPCVGARCRCRAGAVCVVALNEKARQLARWPGSCFKLSPQSLLAPPPEANPQPAAETEAAQLPKDGNRQLPYLPPSAAALLQLLDPGRASWDMSNEDLGRLIAGARGKGSVCPRTVTEAKRRVREYLQARSRQALS